MTDERVDEALRRAAEHLANPVRWEGDSKAREFLEGWAEAAKLLHCWHWDAYEDSDGSNLMPPVMHDGICDAACGDSCKPCKARARFVKAMLG